MCWVRRTAAYAVMAVLVGGGAYALQPSEEPGERQLGDEGSISVASTVSWTPTVSLVSAVPELETITEVVKLDDRAPGDEDPLGPDEVDEKGAGAAKQEAEHAPACHADNSPISPFCLPEDGKKMYVGGNYLVTWDPDALSVNSTVVIGIAFVNDTEGKSPYISSEMPSTLGFMRLFTENDWLDGKTHNNLTFYVAEHDPHSGKRVRVIDGPMIQLWRRGAEPLTPPEYRFNRKVLAVGIPICALVVFIIVFGLFYFKRNCRRIGRGNIMGGRLRDIKDEGEGVIRRLGSRHHRRYPGDLDENNESRGLESLPLYKHEPIVTDEELAGPFVSARPGNDPFNETQRTGGYAFRQDDVSRMRMWN